MRMNNLTRLQPSKGLMLQNLTLAVKIFNFKNLPIYIFKNMKL